MCKGKCIVNTFFGYPTLWQICNRTFVTINSCFRNSKQKQGIGHRFHIKDLLKAQLLSECVSSFTFESKRIFSGLVPSVESLCNELDICHVAKFREIYNGSSCSLLIKVDCIICINCKFVTCKYVICKLLYSFFRRQGRSCYIVSQNYMFSRPQCQSQVGYHVQVPTFTSFCKLSQSKWTHIFLLNASSPRGGIKSAVEF